MASLTGREDLLGGRGFDTADGLAVGAGLAFLGGAFAGGGFFETGFGFTLALTRGATETDLALFRAGFAAFAEIFLVAFLEARAGFLAMVGYSLSSRVGPNP
jgi:hypothetical protein